MHRLLAAATCVTFVLAGATAALAGTTGNGSAQPPTSAKTFSHGEWIMVALGPEDHRVIVEFGYNLASNKTTIASYAYNPANGNINQLSTPAENVNPTTGIGIVVKCPPPKGPCTASHRQVPLNNGVGTLSALMPEAGTYTVIVTVQAHAINTKGTGADKRTTATGASMTSTSATTALPAKTMLLTFHVVVDAKGNMAMDTKMPPTATAAPPREPMQ